MDLGGSVLGIGLAGTMLNRSVDFSQLHPTSEGDPLLQGLGEESDLLFDFNAGIFWQIPDSVVLAIIYLKTFELNSKAK